MAYPRWINPKDEINLRAVASKLYVGGEKAPALCQGARWRLIVDLYGESLDATSRRGYSDAESLLAWPFNDGNRVPSGLLDVAVPLIGLALRRGPVLIHCQAGLSRSASVAYAVLRYHGGLTHQEALSRVITPGYEKIYPKAATLKSARVWVQQQRRSAAAAMPQPQRRAS